MKLREKLKYSGPGVRTRVSGGARGLDGGVHRSRKEGAPRPVVAGESVGSALPAADSSERSGRLYDRP